MDKKYLPDDVSMDRSVINNGEIMFSGFPTLIYPNSNPVRDDYPSQAEELHYKASHP